MKIIATCVRIMISLQYKKQYKERLHHATPQLKLLPKTQQQSRLAQHVLGVYVACGKVQLLAFMVQMLSEIHTTPQMETLCLNRHRHMLGRKHNPEKANNAKCSKTKPLWFSCPLRHSARNRGGLILQRPRAYTGHRKIHN